MRTSLRTTVQGILFSLLCACSTPKDIAYFQDAEALQGMALQAEQAFRLQPEDKIQIIVNSGNAMLDQQFTLTAASSTTSMLGAETTQENMGGSHTGIHVAYTVDEQGTIDFPVLGRIRAKGLTRTELAAYIKRRLTERELAIDPIVTVEYVNLSVNVLGEVAKPGHIAITRDHFTIIDALSRAGDLTIDGNRRSVMVTRNVNGVNQVYYLDLTNMQQTLLSPAYYLKQNDLVYVAPNDKRQRESTARSNVFHNPSIWISIASFITTVIALIAR